MAEPKWDIVTEDVMDAMRIGQAVQEAELDATVRQHPWCLPGYAILIDREELGKIEIGPVFHG